MQLFFCQGRNFGPDIYVYILDSVILSVLCCTECNTYAVHVCYFFSLLHLDCLYGRVLRVYTERERMQLLFLLVERKILKNMYQIMAIFFLSNIDFVLFFLWFRVCSMKTKRNIKGPPNPPLAPFHL